MLFDLAGGTVGVLVFALMLLLPGYAVGWVADICQFRSRGVREQLAWSVALSFGVSPIVIVALVWLFGIDFAAVSIVVIAVGTVVLAWRSKRIIDLNRRQLTFSALLALAWTALVLLSLTDLGVHNRLWMSVTSYDFAVRAPFVSAVAHTGVPPANPLYWAGRPAPMRYYYFWYVICAVVAKIAHIAPRQALVASCVWPPAGVLAMLALFGRHLLGWRGVRLTRAWWLAFALLGVTGLDIVANIGARLAGAPMEGDMEWWSVDQVASWTDTFLWVPHHAAALVACLLCILLLWRCSVEPQPVRRIAMAVVAGVSFAGAFGLSTFVAAGTAIVLSVWLLWRLRHDDRLRVIGCCFLAAGVAVVLLLPYLLQLHHREPGGPQASAAVLGFSIRRIVDPNVLNDVPGLRSLRVRHPFLEINLAALILLLPGYITELGFYFFVLLRASRRPDQWTPGERCLVFLTWVSLLAVTLLRSRVLTSNDYGFRASLLMQFFLVLLGVLVLERSSGWGRRWLLFLAAVGFVGTAYQVVVLRGYLIWNQKQGNPGMAELAERNYAFREAFEAIDRHTPADARVQYNDATAYFMASQMMQSNRQMIDADPSCATSFGGDPSACPAIQRAVAALYSESTGPAAANRLCAQTGIQYLIASRWDRVWLAPESWVWTLPPVLERPEVRVLACGKSSP
jgi:hypothetical protein